MAEATRLTLRQMAERLRELARRLEPGGFDPRWTDDVRQIAGVLASASWREGIQYRSEREGNLRVITYLPNSNEEVEDLMDELPKPNVYVTRWRIETPWLTEAGEPPTWGDQEPTDG